MMDSIRRWFFGQVAYPAAVWARREDSVFQRLHELRRVEAESSTATIEAAQQHALAQLLVTAARVPYYAALLGNAGRPTVESARRVLTAMPPLEKVTLQRARQSLENPHWTGRVVRKTTGGSTGRPVTVVKNADAIAQEMAATWMGYGWFDVGIGDPCVRFWGRPVANWRRRLRYLAADAAMHRLTLSAFGYDRSDLRRYLTTINRFRPRYLYGYVSALEDLARAARAAGVRIPTLRSVVTTSEVLTPPQRSAIEEAFGVPVQNEYGCGEVGPIAYQCPSGSLHLLPTNQLVEIVGPDGQALTVGEPGTILITDLTNHAMPLIRYRVGDTAAFGDPCACGRPFPTLVNVFGREYDFVTAPDGSRYHGEFFMYIFEDLRKSIPALEKFQVVQTEPARLIVKIVGPDDLDSPHRSRAVEEEFRRRLPEFELAVERVERVPRLPSGKTRVVENRILRGAEGNVLPSTE